MRDPGSERHRGRFSSRPRRRLASGCRFGLALLLGTTLPIAEAAGDDGSDWRFSFSLGMIAQAQDVAGSVASSFPARASFEPGVEDDPVVLVPAIPLGLRVDAPRLLRLDRPIRPFIHGRVVLPMDEDRSIVRQGTIPNPVEIPVD
ncbi:MAG: hypothetical protein GY910_27805, partial [bacterium]|nr:hypothetical protein [bacterium]